MTSAPNTRLSLYKLLLPTTVWVAITPAEYARILAWLERHRSSTSRRNAVDNLYETFLWFPSREGDRIYVPLGHMSRLFAQVEERIPKFAASDHPSVRFRDSLRGPRGELTGHRVMLLRSSIAVEGTGQ